MKINYRADIDGLRALAVLGVVIFHAFPQILPGGFIGVDVFFVISGFLISTIIFKNLAVGHFSFIEFYGRRIRRIFPALITVLLTCLIVGWFTLLTDEYKQLSLHTSAGAGFILNFILLKEVNYFDNASLTKPLLHLWSLGIEEQFYIFWPLMLYAVRYWRHGILFLLMFGTIASFVSNIIVTAHNPSEAFYLPYTRFWELLLGAQIAYFSLYPHLITKTSFFIRYGGFITKQPIKDILSFVGLAMIGIVFFVLNHSQLFPGAIALIPVMGAAFIIIAGPTSLMNRTLLMQPVMKEMGLISFPLYLWHWPILSFLYIIKSEPLSSTESMIAIMASILLAWGTYRFIECPIRFSKKNQGFKTVVLCALVAMLLVIGGVFTYKADDLGKWRGMDVFQGNMAELIRTPSADEACRKYIGSDLLQYCRFNDVGGLETVAVIGDSHAHVAYAGIAQLLSEQHINTLLMASGNCPSFIGSEFGKTDSIKDLCKRYTEKIISVLFEKKEIKKVFIFSRGSLYMSGHGFGYTELDMAGPPTIPPQQFRNTLLATIKILQNSGKTAYYVAENPELGFSIGVCLDRPYRQISQSCHLDKSTALDRQQQYLEILDSLPKKSLIYVLNAFCPKDKCMIIDEEHRSLYADDDHLSLTGSKFQAEHILRPYLISK